MNPLACIKLLFTEDRMRGNPSDVHPAILQTFFFLVLPLSFLPPAMLLYAGHFHPAAFLIDVPFARWVDVAIAFFVTELLTVPLIAWVIRDLAGMLRIENDYRQAFLVAGMTPVPLWISSTALAVPNLAFLIVAVASGLLLSALLLYRAVRAVFAITNEEDAQALSSSAFSVGGLAWAILCGIVVLPLIG
ncbi:MAG TPA: YIP1 family protein [Noviherbaspirillum sp.]